MAEALSLLPGFAEPSAPGAVVRAGAAADVLAANSSTRFSKSGHPGSARTRRKSSFVAASVVMPSASRRSSMTSESSGRPLRLCARASIRISSGSFGRPFRIARHARS